ncbi:riboflavin synthase subunit alpha [Buchnera aphidicola]|uniref:Riboflavin synthase n=1 Tax=Buchnera aphidicola subsp. Rhopalosiphum maidis TaxID=118109 RepID=A0A3G2I630_BUCRM|nr:riboflavin synthase subunit alpha [Buchnera aphidicola]AYN24398.1 riboflavin synthase subunit alpha [Buchnera aphidicola (Rhopalosiphum maidis)]
MFTGIVNGIAQVVSIDKKKDFHTYTVNFSPILLKNLKIGDSVAHNGCCVTVKCINNMYVLFDIMKITIENTNLGILNIGDYVNIERSLKYGDEMGGHIISGHIMNTAEISKILKLNENYILWCKVKDYSLMKYIFYKGFICIDGISLTISNIMKNEFCISIIPETLSSTTIGYKKIGQLVNVEIDFYTQIIVDTTKRLIKKNISRLFR